MNLAGRVLLTLALAAAPLGCAVDQQKEVATYRHVLDGEQAPPAPPYDPKQPLTLAHALQLANAHNEQLAIAGETYLQALIDKDRAVATFLPMINLTPTYTLRDKTALSATNPLISQFSPTHTMDVPINAQLNVNPLQDAAAVSAATSYAQSAEAQLRDAQQQLLLDTARTFFAVLSAEKNADVLTRSVAVQQQRVQDSQSKYDAGVGRALDVSQNRAHLADTQVRLIDARHAVTRGRAMLAPLIGVERVDSPLSDVFNEPTDNPALVQLVDIAYANRQDLIGATARIASSTAALKAAWARYFPSVSLDLTYFLDRQTFPTDVDWMSVIKLHVPLFSAGLIHADVRTAYSHLRQAKLTETWIARQVRRQVTVSWDDWHSAAQRVKELHVQVQAAQEAFDQAEATFNAGLTTNLERMTAQDDLLNAQLALATAQYDQTIRCLELIRALGRLTPERLTRTSDALSLSEPLIKIRPRAAASTN